jgi:Tol biopolymer transport system component
MSVFKLFTVLFPLTILFISCTDSIIENEPLSPEGKYKILFVSFENSSLNLNTIWSDGTGLKTISDFTKCYNPQWTFDGKNIVFISESYPKSIWIMDSTGSNKQKLIEGSEFICSPFEDKLCFIREVYNGDNFVGWAIYSIKMDGSELTRLTTLDYQKYGLCWSSDLSHIYYTLNDNISGKFEIVYRLNINNKLVEKLFEGYEIPQVSDFSKNDDYIIFSANHADVFKYDLVSKKVIQLTTTGSRDEFAKISPTNDKIAFTSGREGINQIFVMNNDGSNQHNISKSVGGAMFPKYSPDGSMIAYLSSEDGKTTQITICNANEKNKRSLVLTNYYTFEWCPVK